MPFPPDVDLGLRRGARQLRRHNRISASLFNRQMWIAIRCSYTRSMSMRSPSKRIFLPLVTATIQSITSRLTINSNYLLIITIWRCSHLRPLSCAQTQILSPPPERTRNALGNFRDELRRGGFLSKLHNSNVSLASAQSRQKSFCTGNRNLPRIVVDFSY